jgi:hypothetical protein
MHFCAHLDLAAVGLAPTELIVRRYRLLHASFVFICEYLIGCVAFAMAILNSQSGSCGADRMGMFLLQCVRSLVALLGPGDRAPGSGV